ncbi:MAG: MotA/TolQ/ExbB proton channel family protein [Solibacillus sp.]
MDIITGFIEGLSTFTIFYVAVQIAIFSGLLIWYILSKKTEQESLNYIRKAIEQKNENGEALTNYSLNELFKQQNQKSKYVQQWNRYYSRISEKEADEKIKVAPYFGMGALHFAIGERGILEVGGGVHTSLGVLGTFIGLTFGLSGLDTLDPEQLRGGIENLISGMTTAFVTSVFGVILSLIWIFIDRKITMKLEDEIDWHANELSLLLNADDEEIFLNRLEKISAQQAEQMTTLLTDALEKAFTPFMQTMQSNNESIVTGFTKMESQLTSQNELTQQQIELAKHQSSDLSEKLVQSLTSDTKDVIEEFVNVLNHSKTMQENMVNSVGQITTRFEQASEHQEQLFERTEQMIQSYAVLSEGMEKSQNSYEKTSEELSALSVSLKEVQQLSNAQLPLQQEILSRSSEFVESSNNLVTQFSTFGQQLKASQDTMLEQLMQKTELISTRFEALASELTQSANAYLQANNSNLQLLAKTEQTVEQLSPVVGYMEGTAEALNNTMGQLELLQERQAELVPHLQEWNEDVLTYLKDFVGLSEKQMEEISSQISYSKSQWESTATTFEDTRKQLATAMDSFSIGIEKGLTTTFQEFESELTQVVQHFKSLSGTYLESQENLTEAMNQTVEQLAFVRGRE